MQESERKLLARELHDELGQYLNAIKTDAVSIRSAVPPPARPPRRSSSNVDHVHGVVSDLIRRLRPVGLDDLGLRAALEHYLTNAQQRLPQVRIETRRSKATSTRSSEAVNVTIYRIAQEGMTNVGKHSGASRVELRVTRTGADVEIDHAATTGAARICMPPPPGSVSSACASASRCWADSCASTAHPRRKASRVHARIPASPRAMSHRITVLLVGRSRRRA